MNENKARQQEEQKQQTTAHDQDQLTAPVFHQENDDAGNVAIITLRPHLVIAEDGPNSSEALDSVLENGRAVLDMVAGAFHPTMEGWGAALGDGSGRYFRSRECRATGGSA